MIELEILYHGAKSKRTVKVILDKGFKPWTYFARDLNDAIHMGGKYVFLVVFDKADLPDNWQVRCENAISPGRITELLEFSEEPVVLYKNKGLNKKIKSNATDQPTRVGYCFKEKRINLNELI